MYYLVSEVFSSDVPQQCSTSALLHYLLQQNAQNVQRMRRKASKGECGIKRDLRERDGSAEGERESVREKIKGTVLHNESAIKLLMFLCIDQARPDICTNIVVFA